jgi:hypothetical protein
MTCETTTIPAQPIVTSGVIIAFRLFDIAYAIDLAKVELVWAARARSASRGRLTATPPKAVAFDVPPVSLVLDPLTLMLDGAAVQAEVTARLYDFGAVSIALRVAIRDLPWSAFVAQVNAVDRSVGQAHADPWTNLLQVVRTAIAPALVRPASSSALQEDYLIGVTHSFDQPMTAALLQERVDVVPLLSGERRTLSDGARQDLLRQRFSYYSDDLVVLTWDRAFIYEPRGDSDVIDVLEVANAQLLEMRYYDELLDDELPRMYDLVETERRKLAPLAARRFANLARRFHTLVAEVTELTEKVDNALQVTEDVYLARIYSAALDLFRVSTVSAAVDRKLAIIRDTYSALYDEASSSRAELLEVLIVLLIVVEIVLALIRR